MSRLFIILIEPRVICWATWKWSILGLEMFSFQVIFQTNLNHLILSKTQRMIFWQNLTYSSMEVHKPVLWSRLKYFLMRLWISLMRNSLFLKAWWRSKFLNMNKERERIKNQKFLTTKSEEKYHKILQSSS